MSNREFQAIVALVTVRVGKMLTVAETALPPSQFKAFRKLMLDEFGRNGLESALFDLINQDQEPRKG